MNKAITVNRLKPIVDRVFPFDDVIGAFRYYAAGENFGKIVITHEGQ
jgi:NADPH:quinone reductase-like Zn-dependent oxidoreductase